MSLTGSAALDLHEEFRACCLDEEEFRAQLTKYASGGETPLRPIDVPPLVYSSGLLSPTSKNKMHHAKRAFGNLGGEFKERTLAPTNAIDIEYNWGRFRQLVDGCGLGRKKLELALAGERIEFSALAAIVGSSAVMEFLRTYRWSRAGVCQDFIDFLEGEWGNPEIDDWCVLIPELKTPSAERGPRFGNLSMDVHIRSRIGSDRQRYKVFSDPSHASVAKWIAGNFQADSPSDDAGRLKQPRRAVLAAYACRAKDEGVVNLGFFCCFPPNKLPWKVAFITNQPKGT